MDKGFIFFPDARVEATPENIGLPFEDLYLKTADGVQINAWFIPHPSATTTLLWFHGNGGNLGDRVDQLRMFHATLPAHILMLDYREYGRSQGEVSEEGTYRDAETVYDYLHARRGGTTGPTRMTSSDPGRIIAYGQSLGAAVALELALRRPIDALILEAPFLSIREMANVHYGWLPLGRLITTEYDNIGKIGKVHIPVLILHGDQDETVPYEHGQRLFTVANPPKQFYTIRNSGHNDTYRVGGASYFETLDVFLEK